MSILNIDLPESKKRKARRGTNKFPGRPRTFHNFERGLNFLYVSQLVLRGDKQFVWPVLYIIENGGDNTCLIRLDSLLDYFEEHSARSHQWRVIHARAIGHMIDHSVEALRTLSDQQRKATGEPIERYLLRKFALSVVKGTVVVDKHKTRTDRLNLFWHARGKEADRILAAVSRYLNWLGERDVSTRWAFAASVDVVLESPIYAFRMAAELAIRKRKSLLSYVKGEERKPSHRYAGITGERPRANNPVYSFPNKYVVPLLFEGFRSDGGEIDHAAELIALFLLGGGLRSCEPFHFFVSDVQFLANEPVVFMHHPQHGRIISQGTTMDRADYLSRRYGLLPRNKQSGAGKAGWKSVLGDETGTPVFWLPVQALQERITNKLRRYVMQIRPAIMRARPPHLGDHPFLFVNPRDSINSGGGNIGDPYTMTALRGAWERAVGRIARIRDDPALTVKKEMGTTLHGPRHHYGRFLRTLDLPPDVIQRAMHHRSIFSQDAYTRLTAAEINAFIKRSVARADLSQMNQTIMMSIDKFENQRAVI